MKKEYQYKRPEGYPQLSAAMAVNEKGELIDMAVPDIDILGIYVFPDTDNFYLGFWYDVESIE